MEAFKNKIGTIKNKITIPIVFLIIVFIEGIVFSQVIPLGQVPDEMTHYRFMSEETGLYDFYSELANDVWVVGGFCDIPRNPDVKVDNAKFEKVSSSHFDSHLSLSNLNISIKSVRHLPATIGFVIGIIFGLPILWCTYLAEFFSLLFYALMGFIILKIVPVKKDIFMFCLLLPMSMQQGISVNYDAVLNPCCIFLFAYILKLFYQDEKIKWRNIFVMLGVLIPIAIIKAPYTLIIFSALIIPLSKYDLKIRNFDLVYYIKKYWLITLLLFVSCVMLLVYLGRGNTYIKALVSDFLNIGDTFSLFQRTISEFSYYHLQQLIGMFGWLDSTVSSMFIIFTIVILTYLNCNRTEDTGEVVLNTARRIIMFVAGLLVMLLIYIALQAWTYEILGYDIYGGIDKYGTYISKIDLILGVQGRYFIPCLPILLVAVSGDSVRKNKISYYIVQGIYYSISFISVIILLHSRYWK